MRKSNSKKRKLLGRGKNCPKCRKPMNRYTHTDDYENSPKAMKKAYIFLWWDLCHSCRHLQHYEEAKFWHHEKVIWDD